MRELAMLFGSEQQWNEAALAVTLEAALERDWSSLEQVADALCVATPAHFAKILASRFSFSNRRELSEIVEYLLLRDDEPDALLEAAESLDLTKSHPRRIAEMLALHAATLYAADGRPIPERVYGLLFFEFASEVYPSSLSLTIAGLRAVPAERVHALMRARLDQPYGYSNALIGLAAHWDAALWMRFLEHDRSNGHIRAELFGLFGTRIVPDLLEALEAAAPDKRRNLHMGLLEAMAHDPEEPLDPAWEQFVSFDVEGDDEIGYWTSDRAAVRRRFFAKLAPERRISLLRNHISTSKWPERATAIAGQLGETSLADDAIQALIAQRKTVDASQMTNALRSMGTAAVDSLCRHIHLSGGDAGFMGALKGALSHQDYQRVEAALGSAKEAELDALRRLCAAASGPRERVYLLESRHKGIEPRAGTLSRSGGQAPGLQADEVPVDADGERLEHLFTLDLEELADLQPRFEGARAIAFFCPEPEFGERFEELEIVQISAEAAARHPNTGHGEEPIAVVALDVATSVFDESSDEPDVENLRDRVFNAAGHVLGSPIWIQHDESGSNFLMQINEALCDINLGDTGSLYVFDDGVVFQCF